MIRSLTRPFFRLGPFALSIFTMLSGLLILSLSRLLLTLMNLDRFDQTPEYLWLFPIGVRMDFILMCYTIFIPTVLFFTLPKQILLRGRKLLAALLAFFMSFVVYMEIATPPFIQEYDLRPDEKFWEYLKHYKEVFGTLLKTHLVELTIGAVAVVIFGSIFFLCFSALIFHFRDWKWRTKIVLFPFITVIMVYSARNSFGPRPANLSSATFSDNHLANELALNSAYSSLYAAYRLIRHDKNPSLSYGAMPREEILERVAKNVGFSLEQAKQEIPFLHVQDSPFDLPRPMNVVIFLQESMGAVDVGCLEGPDITPNLCRLKEEGLWFPNLYATGTRTVRGIEATLSGFLPTSAPGVVKLAKAKNGFFTAAALFRQHGYESEFHYGGLSNFDEMKSFFLGNDFERIYDQESFENPAFLGTWGVSDEDLVKKANEVFKSHGDKPFFAYMLSTTNHSPYEFPDGRIELYEQPKPTHFNAIKFADYAIGLLMDLAKKEKYYENTLFLIVADHNSHVKGNDLVPIQKFRIPGLLIGPNVPKGEVATLASQIDLLPTVLHFTGLKNVQHPMVGRNLINLPPGTPGRAFMQYASHNAYRVGDEVIIHRPFLPPSQFTYKDQALIPSKLDAEMAKDALAFTHFPWILYSEKRYKIPVQGHLEVD